MVTHSDRRLTPDSLSLTFCGRAITVRPVDSLLTYEFNRRLYPFFSMSPSDLGAEAPAWRLEIEADTFPALADYPGAKELLRNHTDGRYRREARVYTTQDGFAIEDSRAAVLMRTYSHKREIRIYGPEDIERAKSVRRAIQDIHRILALDAGALILEASATATEAGAVLIPGPSGSGKTTQAATCLRLGHDLIANEEVVISDDRGAIVHGMPIHVMVREAATRRFPELAWVVDFDGDEPKRSIEAREFAKSFGRRLVTSAPLRAVLLPQPGQGCQVLSPTQTYERLVAAVRGETDWQTPWRRLQQSQASWRSALRHEFLWRIATTVPSLSIGWEANTHLVEAWLRSTPPV